MPKLTTEGTVHKMGLPPGTLLHMGRAYNEKVRTNVLTYNAGQAGEKADASLAELSRAKEPGTISWIRVIGLHDTAYVEKIGECFSIHPLVLEDIVNTHRRPRCEDYGSYLYIVLKSFHIEKCGDELTADQISLIVGDNYLISFEERENRHLDPLRARILDAAGLIRNKGSDYLAYALIDIIVDHYFVVLEDIGDKIETLEEELVIRPGSNAIQEIHELKRKMLLFRKALWPLREVIGSLGRGESPFIKEGTLIYLRDVYDHTIQVLDTLETYRDILSGMLDIYLSSISNKMNQIMKVLTVISTIFIPLTFIAGVYGMNFKYMPELELVWAYPAVLVFMLAISLGMIRYFHTRKWL